MVLKYQNVLQRGCQEVITDDLFYVILLYCFLLILHLLGEREKGKEEELGKITKLMFSFQSSTLFYLTLYISYFTLYHTYAFTVVGH